mmetsp:Transcript_9826/g.16195  ORF Transcript_9826/g.16195 Transcript_9826/m.16195 type:complete len:450 (-) Transcript_9826:201-1550(-)|eukprot:CAMPEP_0174969392 /NCGR_PEP_ID=MMETSP0004_2-20121128/8733_1 /TAXON_ID=420556 /ORGANISM="Ochromonas sp., Strain CCMP1393" /LENGTH=449 /DNA_ID=CAMNT_0016218869 /DNA_START=143 /DNA_END=1492 /DNA_ORIENTATION=-
MSSNWAFTFSILLYLTGIVVEAFLSRPNGGINAVYRFSRNNVLIVYGTTVNGNKPNSDIANPSSRKASPHLNGAILKSQWKMSSPAKYDYEKFSPGKTDVRIEAPSMNTRRITADVIINAPVDKVWQILSDYNNLATHVPNLIQSYLVPVPGEPDKIRLFQEGAQKIIGFDFRASLTMDMEEFPAPPSSSSYQYRRQLGFTCVESRMFNAFDGTWNAQHFSRTKVYDPKLNKQIFRDRTKLTYSVFVKPRGPVPVIALEWRIKEDVPVNLWAVKLASERLPYSNEEISEMIEAADREAQLLQKGGERSNINSNEDDDEGSSNNTRGPPPPPPSNSRRSDKNRKIKSGVVGAAAVRVSDSDWDDDETLGSYIAEQRQQQQGQLSPSSNPTAPGTRTGSRIGARMTSRITREVNRNINTNSRNVKRIFDFLPRPSASSSSSSSSNSNIPSL